MFVSCVYELECENEGTELCKSCSRNTLVKDNFEEKEGLLLNSITVYNDTKTTAEKALSICKECDCFNECPVEKEIKEGHIECAALMDVINCDIESVNQYEEVK